MAKTCVFCNNLNDKPCKSIEEASGCSSYDSNDFDFGFTFGDTEEQVTKKEKEKVDTYKIKMDRLYKAILPFLDNLAKNPDQPIIWKDRDIKIEEFKQKLKKIIE